MPHRWFPAVTAPGGISNSLLATLPATDLDLMRPELAMVALDQDAVLSRAGEPIEYVFFPHSGAISANDRHGGWTDGCHSRSRTRGRSRHALDARAVTVGRYRRRTCGGHRRADPCIAISRRFQPQPRDPARGPEIHQSDAG